MVEEEFVTSMEYFGQEENGRVHKQVLSPKWKVDTIELQCPRLFQKGSKVPWVSLLNEFGDTVECELAHMRGTA